MKLRFTTLDVLATVTELKNCICGFRIVNIYDVNYKTYLFKLVRDDTTAVLLIESGIRVHTTEFAWPKNQFPSAFAMKLRKHLRNRHITNVFQLGVDRIICFKIGKGKDTNYVIVELFDKGNIILCDAENKISAILRRRQSDNKEFAIGSEYSLKGQYSLDTDCTKESIEKSLEQVEDKTALPVKDFLFRQFHIGLGVIEQLTNKTPTLKQPLSNVGLDEIVALHEKISTIIKRLSSEPCKGIITYQAVKEGETTTRYGGFSPLLNNEESDKCILFDTFCKAVDAYYSQVEKQREDQDINQKEKTALSKLRNVATDIERRSKGLQDKQVEYAEKATIIQQNAEIVGQALLVLQNALANHLSWEEVNEMVVSAKQQNNAVASIIEELRFIEGIAVLNLWDESSESYKKVEVDIGLSVYSNVQTYHSLRKELADKEKRTKEATEKALKSAKKKTDKMMKQTEAIVKIGKRRKYFWFEKFHWFISSQNYLVIAGRDQHQNTLLVKKYLSADDIYVHATIQGASSVVIKNYKGGAVPMRTLNEAALMAVCYSRSWDNKVICPAYWVHADQVSRSAPTGEYLTSGGFIITGKRNFIQPDCLVMGFGLMFKIGDEDFEKNHKDDARFQAVNDVEIDSENIQQSQENDEVIRLGSEEIFVEQSVKHVKSHPQKMMRQVAKKKSEARKNKPQVEYDETRPIKKKLRSKKKPWKNVLEDEEDLKEQRKIKAEIEGQCIPITEEKSVEIGYQKPDDTDKIVEALSEQIENVEIIADKPSDNVSDEEDVVANDEFEKATDDEEEDAKMESVDILNTLIEKPHKEDELLFCLAVCAPYSALSNFRFKAKLQPGTTKRGKAGKQIINSFCQDKLTTPTEKNLIKAMKEAEICQNIPGSVKVSALRVLPNLCEDKIADIEK